MSFVSRISLLYHGAGAPSLGCKDVTSARRDLTAGTAVDGLASALSCLPPESVGATCSRPRASSPHDGRQEQRALQRSAGRRHPVASSMFGACAQRPAYPIFHGRDVHGRLRKDPHRGQVRGVGSLYLAARKTPPDGARRIASKYLAQNHKRSLHYLLLPTNCVEWVEERVRNSIRNPNHP